MDDYALCVGIGDYLPESHLGALPGARADAKRFRDWLVSPVGGGVPAHRCCLIQSPLPQSVAGPLPVAETVAKWFRKLFRATMASEDAGRGSRIGRRLYFYLSGHGISIGETPETVLLTADAEPPAACDHVAARLWVDWFRLRGAFEQVMLVMDCCRSGMRSVHVNGPPWQLRTVPRPAPQFYAYAVADGVAAREVVGVDGKPIGKFTQALLRYLDDPARRPLTASTLKGLLYGALDGSNEPAIEIPANPRDDFVIAPVGPAPVIEDPTSKRRADTLVVFDDTLHGSPRLASAMRLGGERVVPLRMLAAGHHEVSQLVIESDQVSESVVTGILGYTPARMVRYGNGPAADGGHIDFVRAHERDSPLLAAARVRAVLEGLSVALLHVRAEDDMARILVWDPQGNLLAEGTGAVWLDGLPRATYRVRARIGGSAWTTDHVLERDSTLVIPALALDTAAPIEGGLRWTVADRAALALVDRAVSVTVAHRGLDGQRLCGRGLDGQELVARVVAAGGWTVAGFAATGSRLVLELPILGGTVALSLPVRSGQRTEIYVDTGPRLDVSIRLVSGALPVGAPVPTDRRRESLRLALIQDGLAQPMTVLEPLGDDPIAALLASVHTCASPATQQGYVDRAAIVLGGADADVIAGRAGGGLVTPPLLAASWARLAATGSDVIPGSLADRVADRRVALTRWFAWDPDPAAGNRSWLRAVAGAMWPAWDSEPATARPQVRLTEAGGRMGMPSGCVYRLTQEAPPVDRLVWHDTIAFVGASNDQLAAALAIAFIERAQRSWQALTLWFLDDDPLDQVYSAGRSGASLRRARDRAQGELVRLLPVIAARWRVVRYAGLKIMGKAHFASLWDWNQPGGFVHVSPYRAGEDVRTTVALDATWPDAAAVPSPAYRAAVQAYAELAPSQTVAASTPAPD